MEKQNNKENTNLNNNAETDIIGAAKLNIINEIVYKHSGDGNYNKNKKKYESHSLFSLPYNLFRGFFYSQTIRGIHSSEKDKFDNDVCNVSLSGAFLSFFG